MIVKRPALKRTIVLLAIFSIALLSNVILPLQGEATASSTKKSKRKHKPSHHVNMSLVPPPPPTLAIPEGMLLAVPPPAILASGLNQNTMAFNPYQTAMPAPQAPHHCAHCGYSGNSGYSGYSGHSGNSGHSNYSSYSGTTYLAPTMSNSSTFYRPFPRRTFYNADSMTTMSVSKSRKTRSERLTKRFKKRKCIFANR